MDSTHRWLRPGLHVLLVALILWLSVVLYRSLTEPYAAVRARTEATEKVRERMMQVRAVLVRHEAMYGRFPRTLDSLVAFARADSLHPGAGFVVDSLPFSPRTGRLFLYSVNDTSRIDTYLLGDPDSGDRIGTLEPDVTMLHAPSWE